MAYQTQKYKLGVLTISDAGARGERADTSGDAISEILKSRGFIEICRTIVSDDVDKISDILSNWSDSDDIDLLLHRKLEFCQLYR